MWRKIALIVGGEYKQVHDYFHNTWTKQIYDDYTPFAHELKHLAICELDKNMNEVLDEFCRSHPDKNFCRR